MALTSFHLPRFHASASPETEVAGATRLLPPYKLLLLNDDYHGMDFVIETLVKVMRWPASKATEVMLAAHHEGQALLMVGPLEIVELKHEQIRSVSEGKKGPLICVIEKA
jgi:ATP-dependent Clp protease adaptor protein ClpS